MSSHKRKRNVQDIPVAKIQEAKEKLKALQKELSEINETTREQIMMHIDVL
jgi:hypothetical protein